jgi:hypothetical protein
MYYKINCIWEQNEGRSCSETPESLRNTCMYTVAYSTIYRITWHSERRGLTEKFLGAGRGDIRGDVGDAGVQAEVLLRWRTDTQRM